MINLEPVKYSSANIPLQTAELSLQSDRYLDRKATDPEGVMHIVYGSY